MYNFPPIHVVTVVISQAAGSRIRCKSVFCVIKYLSNVIYVLVFICVARCSMFFCTISAKLYIYYQNGVLFLDDLFANLLVSVLLTAVVYMAFPLIRLAINHGKFEKKRAKKIALWNSIVVGAFFCIVTIGTSDGGTTWNAAPAVMYYFINRALLTDKYAPESKAPAAKPVAPAANKPAVSTPVSTVAHSLSSANDKLITPSRNDISGSEFRVIKPETAQVANSTSASAEKPILFCRKCGNKLMENSAFCNKCGTKICVEQTKK